MKGKDVVFSHSRDDWETPQCLFDGLNMEFNFDLDATASDSNTKCKYYFKEDALNAPWWGTVFCNPPYSQWQKFVEKAWNEHLKGSTVVLLLPARTDTKAFHKYIWPYAEIRFLKGRLKFEIEGKPVLDKHGKPQSAPFPSMVVIFR